MRSAKQQLRKDIAGFKDEIYQKIGWLTKEHLIEKGYTVLPDSEIRKLPKSTPITNMRSWLDRMSDDDALYLKRRFKELENKYEQLFFSKKLA
jgi:hypothetical protein